MKLKDLLQDQAFLATFEDARVPVHSVDLVTNTLRSVFSLDTYVKHGPLPYAVQKAEFDRLFIPAGNTCLHLWVLYEYKFAVVAFGFDQGGEAEMNYIWHEYDTREAA